MFLKRRENRKAVEKMNTTQEGRGFPGGTSGKQPACQCRRHSKTRVRSLGREDPLQEGMATHSSFLAWRSPWMGGLEGFSPQSLKELDTTEAAYHTRRKEEQFSLPVNSCLLNFYRSLGTVLGTLKISNSSIIFYILQMTKIKCRGQAICPSLNYHQSSTQTHI